MRREIYILFLSVFVIISCGSKKYVKDVPYQYSSKESVDKINNNKNVTEKHYTNINDNIENLSDEELRLKEKYSIVLGVMPREITNYDFYGYIDYWLGTPYMKQTLEKQKGVDCSYFVQALYSDVYKTTFSKTPDGIFRSKSLQLFTGRTFLQEGDIIFFRYDKFRPISDVGIYLHNDRILACTNRGLNIYNFNDEYFQLRYVASGRLKR